MRPRSLKPAYCLHKSSGRAFVKLDGRRIYLGRHGTQQSKDAYDRAVGEWIARGRQTAPAAGDDTPIAETISIAEVIAGFVEHAERYYCGPDGKATAPLAHFRLSLRLLNRLYGSIPAASFGPLALENVRAEMLKPKQYLNLKTKKARVRPGWSRRYANGQVRRLIRVFKWAVSKEMIPVAIHAALLAVDPLEAGHTDARETEPVTVVPAADVEAVKLLVSRQVRAMIELQLLTVARPGEICQMRTCDIDTEKGGVAWTYRPLKHKGQHRGVAREIRIGPKAQAVLKPFLKSDLQAFLFSPAEAEQERRQREHEARKTPPSRGNTIGTNRSGKPKRKPGERYGVNSYRQCITRACERAGVPTWHPHMLRHTGATRLRREFGVEGAQVVLGHSTLSATQIYAEADRAKAGEIMLRIG